VDMNSAYQGLTTEQKLYRDRLNIRSSIPELLTAEERTIVDEACVNYEGSLLDLERAVGAFLVGKYVGWKVLRLAHDGSTYAKYEKILGAGAKGFKFRSHCPERGPLARRSVGLVWADRINNFWRVVRGQVPGARSSMVEVDPQLPEGVG
jgi:hypothetical protein